MTRYRKGLSRLCIGVCLKVAAVIGSYLKNELPLAVGELPYIGIVGEFLTRLSAAVSKLYLLR